MSYPIYTHNQGYNQNQVGDPMQQQLLNRQSLLAQSLQQQSLTPDEGQMVSGHYIAPSFTNGLARLLKGYEAKQINDNSDKQITDYQTQKNKDMADFITGMSPKTTQNGTTDTTATPAYTPDQQDRFGSPLPDVQRQPVTTSTPNMVTETPDQVQARQRALAYGLTSKYGADPSVTMAVSDLNHQRDVNDKNNNTTWKDVGDKYIQMTGNGQATGVTMPKGSSPDAMLPYNNLTADQAKKYTTADANTTLNNSTQITNNQLTNATSRANNQSTVGATIRGQNMVDSRASDKTPNAPSGYKTLPDGSLQFIKGGPADPAAKENAPLGNRESVYISRVATSANETAKDLANIVRQPLTVSRGLFGGRQQGGSLLAASKETLANAMTSQDVQSYNVLASGIQRNLASIEASGLAPSGSLTHQMDAMTFKDGDTNFSKLQKLAQIKQIAQAGLETTLSNPRIPQQQRTHFQDISNQIDKAVPFSNGDLLDMQSQQAINPNITIQDVLNQKSKAGAHPSDINDLLKKYGNQ